MTPLVKKGLLAVGVAIVLALLGGGGVVYSKLASYDASMEKVYDLPLPAITLSDDPAVLARGEHLSKSLASCAISECHGSDLAGGKSIVMGPLGTVTGPNITKGGLGGVYTDAELVRLIRHGVKKDGRSVTFMPSFEFNWLPESDIVAIVSFIRSRPAVEKTNGPIEIGLLGKFVDRQGGIKLDIAGRIDHQNLPQGGPPQPTAAYGKNVALFCTGCHGDTFSGGAIPGAPPEIPIPTNITSHPTGIQDWSEADFYKLLDTGIKKNGEKLDPFMPLEALTNMDAVERKALWEYLRSLPPLPFGGR